MGGLHPDENGIIKEEVYGGGKVDKFVGQINLKNFYNDLHDALVGMGFKDVKGKDWKHQKYLKGWAKAGEMVDAEENRTGDMFEHHFQWTEQENGWIDFELKWRAMLESDLTPYGWLVFELNLDCRNLHDVELLEGNSKKVIQEGGFEFRNKCTYYNSLHRDYLNNIPFVKNSPLLKTFYQNRMYGEILEKELHWAEHDVIHGIYHVIEHHFAPHTDLH